MNKTEKLIGELERAANASGTGQPPTTCLLHRASMQLTMHSYQIGELEQLCQDLQSSLADSMGALRAIRSSGSIMDGDYGLENTMKGYRQKLKELVTDDNI